VRNLLFLFAISFAILSCSDDGSGNAAKTPEELLQFTWKVGEMKIDDLAFPINTGNVDKIRITFTPTTYTYVYPAPPDAVDVTPGTMVTLNGTWQLSADKTKILLDRTQISAPVFEWTILKLSPGIFEARYQAINPFNTTLTSNYDFSYTLAL
jgi:hypothetical protein